MAHASGTYGKQPLQVYIEKASNPVPKIQLLEDPYERPLSLKERFARIESEIEVGDIPATKRNFCQSLTRNEWDYIDENTLLFPKVPCILIGPKGTITNKLFEYDDLLKYVKTKGIDYERSPRLEAEIVRIPDYINSVESLIKFAAKHHDTSSKTQGIVQQSFFSWLCCCKNR
jgi:hypothetical protein